MGKLMWKIMGTGAAAGAAVVARKLVNSGWTAVTGKKPARPGDTEVSLPQVLGWAVASGASVQVARVLATRRAAAYYTKSAGHPPKALQESDGSQVPGAEVAV